MKLEILYPSKADHRIEELTSSNLSNESKAITARWYAEMMIKEFLNEHFDGDEYKGASLKYLIENLTGKVSKKIIDSLRLIKEFGDIASHYNPDKKINLKQSQKAVDCAAGLYTLIIIDILKKKSLLEHPDRATLISVLLPSIRVTILSELIQFSSPSQDLILLKKWCLACTKAGKSNKARYMLNQLFKKNQISEAEFLIRTKDIKIILEKMNSDILPIPKDRSDFARNLADVIDNHLTGEESLIINQDLIKVLKSMAENISPSNMNHYKGMQIYAL